MQSTATIDNRLAAAVREKAEALPNIDDSVFGSAFDRFADARVVLLGECTHGSSEFYRARAAITRRLIEHHGFRIVAIEGDWPDVAELDRFVRNRGVWGRQEAFVNFPRWMWRNEEFAAFVRDLRTFNLHRDLGDRAELRGLDIYSLSRSLAEVMRYLDRIDPAAASIARRRYACMTPFLDEPQRYGLAAQLGAVDCEEAVLRQLVALLEQRQVYGSKDGEDFFDAELNARVIAASEGYYRAMYRGSTESWNQRDSHMFETLRRLLDRRGPSSKGIVWAHNSHIGNAEATSMSLAGEYNLGQLCREAFGKECVAVGFGSHHGAVAAASDWGNAATVMQVQPARGDSWEHVFHVSAPPVSLTEWRTDADFAALLNQSRRERAIGVVYRPRTELLSHYFEARLAHQFDAYVWFDASTAGHPLPAGPPEGAPDIYPFGV
jgi:erythromycin esterase-like protein